MSIRKKSALGALIATTALALGACGGVDTGTGSTKSNEPGATAGEVKLHDVPDRTAAMLMAIVADKLGKPLNELRFISIREIKD